MLPKGTIWSSTTNRWTLSNFRQSKYMFQSFFPGFAIGLIAYDWVSLITRVSWKLNSWMLYLRVQRGFCSIGRSRHEDRYHARYLGPSFWAPDLYTYGFKMWARLCVLRGHWYWVWISLYQPRQDAYASLWAWMGSHEMLLTLFQNYHQFFNTCLVNVRCCWICLNQNIIRSAFA